MRRAHNRARASRRNASGQGLLEGACGTAVLMTVFVAILTLGVNIYTVLTVDTTLRLVAMESAKLREEYTFFLGQRRNDIAEQTARDNARAFAVALCKANGLAVRSNDVNFNDVINADQSGTRCTIRLKQLKLPYGGGAFPLILAREVSVVVARMNVPAPALVDINANSEGGTVTVRVPGYGAFRGIQTATTANGRFALNRPDLFQATSLPGVPMPGPVKAKFYLPISLGSEARIMAPINIGGNNKAYTSPNILPDVAQRNLNL